MHDVPEPLIRRRFDRGLQNFFQLFRPLANRWWFFDNSPVDGPRLIASGARAGSEEVPDAGTWQVLLETYR